MHCDTHWVDGLVGKQTENAVQIIKIKGRNLISVLTPAQAALAGRPEPGTVQIIHENNIVTSAVVCD